MNLLKDDLSKQDWNNEWMKEEIEDWLENDISMNERIDREKEQDMIKQEDSV